MPIIFLYLQRNSAKNIFKHLFMGILGFGSEFNDKYLVVFNGCDVNRSFVDKKSALCYAIRCSLVRDRYVELFYQHSNGVSVLINYWN